MTEQAIPEVVAVKQSVDYCSSCSYEALKKEAEES